MELDTPVVELVRIEAPFKSGAIAVRAEATAKPATREGKQGAIIRLTRIEPNSYGVAIPPGSAWPRPEEVSEVPRKPDAPVIARTTTPVAKPAIARTATPHVVRRVLEMEADDPVAEFSEKGSITKNSPVSADLAKQLNERPTPPPTPRTPAIIRRQTPVAGVPSIPKPVEKKIATPPSVPPIDDEWTFDAPTLGPAVKAAKPLVPEIPKSRPTPPSLPVVKAKPPPTPARGLPAVKKLDDDAAFDDAFGMLEDDLSIATEEPSTKAAQPAVEPVTKPARAVSEPKVEAAKPRATSEPAVEPVTKPARAVSEPKVDPKADGKPELLVAEPISSPVRAGSEPRLTGRAVEPKARATSPAIISRGTSESKPLRATSPAVITRASSEPKPRAASEPKHTDFPVAPNADEITKPVAAEEIAKAAEQSARPTPPPVEIDSSKVELVTPEVAKAERAKSEPKIERAKSEPAPARATPDRARSEAASEPEPAKPIARPSSEGVLATARASELAMPTSTNEIDAIEQATSTGVTAASRAASEAVARPASESIRPKSKLPLILVAGLVAIGAIVAVVLATRSGGDDTKELAKPSANKAEVDKHLREAASRIADGKLVGRGGDAALDHLLAAKAIAPNDPQVIAQLRALADTFEKLGDGALAASDLAEAATHYQAALTAEPDRASAKSKLADVENRARGK